MITAVLADDEPPVRARLRSLIGAAPDFAIVAQCNDGLETVAAVEDHSPAVLFLDVQMPGLDGLEVVDAIADHPSPPLIVFVTAFEHYAVRAFDIAAVDYIVKPIDPVRFAHALDRVRAAVGGGKLALPDTEAIAAQLPVAHRYLSRLLVRERDGYVVVPVANIEWIEAEDNYVRLHHASGTRLMRARLSALAARLDPSIFRRVHRSALVNLHAISSVKSRSHGELVAQMRSRAEIPVSRTYSAALLTALKR